MRKLFVAIALSLVIGCSKKEEAKSDKPAEPAKPTAPAAEPPKPADTPAQPADPNAIEDVAAAPEGVPKACTDAHDLMKKVHGCEKLDARTRASLIKAWNLAVKGSLVHYATASDDNKKTIEGSCDSMVKSTSMLTNDC